MGLKGNAASSSNTTCLKYILFLFLVPNNDILCVLDCIQWKHKDMFLWQILNPLVFEEKENIDIPIPASHYSLDVFCDVFDMSFHSARHMKWHCKPSFNYMLMFSFCYTILLSSSWTRHMEFNATTLNMVNKFNWTELFSSITLENLNFWISLIFIVGKNTLQQQRNLRISLPLCCQCKLWHQLTF